MDWANGGTVIAWGAGRGEGSIGDGEHRLGGGRSAKQHEVCQIDGGEHFPAPLPPLNHGAVKQECVKPRRSACGAQSGVSAKLRRIER